MSLTVILTQLLLPLALLAWLAVYPARNAIAWSVQFISAALILLGVGLAALWTLPPFWSPYVYALLFVLIVVRQLIQRAGPGNTSGTTSVANFVVIFIVAGLGQRVATWLTTLRRGGYYLAKPLLILRRLLRPALIWWLTVAPHRWSTYI